MSLQSSWPIYSAAGLWHHNCGKTMLLKMMCSMTGLPFAEVNATKYTDAGYIGLNLEQMFIPLIQNAIWREQDATPKPATAPRRKKLKKDEHPDSLLAMPDEILEPAITAAEHGVVFLDEFDKWMIQDRAETGGAGAVKRTAPPPPPDGGRNVGRKLQAELLKMVEGSDVWVTDTEEELGLRFNTTKVLIVCGGAFTSLERIIGNRIEQDLRDDPKLWERSIPEDFQRYGLMPELSGRLATHIMFKPLREEHLRTILTDEGGLVDEYRQRFQDLGCEFVVEEAGLIVLARRALNLNVGARGLRHMMEKMFVKALYAASVAHGRRGRVVLGQESAAQGEARYAPLMAEGAA